MPFFFRQNRHLGQSLEDDPEKHVVAEFDDARAVAIAHIFHARPEAGEVWGDDVVGVGRTRYQHAELAGTSHHIVPAHRHRQHLRSPRGRDGAQLA